MLTHPDVFAFAVAPRRRFELLADPCQKEIGCIVTFAGYMPSAGSNQCRSQYPIGRPYGDHKI